MTATLVVVVAATGCAGGGSKPYDISPIFPLSKDKCEKYHGTQEGEGFGATCMVSKDDCEAAAADWHEAMKNIPDAVEFSCR